jgi:hypothetical protein
MSQSPLKIVVGDRRTGIASEGAAGGERALIDFKEISHDQKTRCSYFGRAALRCISRMRGTQPVCTGHSDRPKPNVVGNF